MFGIITNNTIVKIHQAFDELDYHINDSLSFDEFQRCAVNSLNHAYDLDDAINVVRMFQYCLKNWNTIETIFQKKLYAWNQIPFEGSSYITYGSDDDSAGVFYVTNGITKNYKNINLCSIAYGEDLYSFENKGGKFWLEFSSYYVKFSAMSSTKMKLFDSYDNCLCNIVLSKNAGIFLEKNKTNFEFFPDENGNISIFDKSYFDSLANDDLVDDDKMIAFLEWDILEKKSDLGVARIVFFEDFTDEEIEILLLIASSTFLLFRRYIKNVEATNAAIANMWIRR